MIAEQNVFKLHASYISLIITVPII